MLGPCLEKEREIETERGREKGRFITVLKDFYTKRKIKNSIFIYFYFTFFYSFLGA